jgi:hypothetical protein
MNEAFTAADQSFCGPCLEKMLSAPGGGSVSTDGIQRMVDPTVCANCAADNGTDAWSTIAALPVCGTCSDFFRNRPFPNWLKLSFVVFLAVAVAAFVYNWRYFKAYVEVIQGGHALERGDIAMGVILLDSAARRVPDVPELAVFPNLFKAQQLVSEDRCEEALALLQESEPFVPDEWSDPYRQTRIYAEMGIAFDNQDYDTFLERAQAIAGEFPGEAVPLASVASAYACKYASTGDPAFREQSLQHLERARELTGQEDEHFPEYENRIQHRLHTREIITRDEFNQRFPNGWKPEEAGG